MTATAPPAWLHDLLVDGLMKLYTLSLDGAPAAELLQGTALTWGEAFVADRVWDEYLDRERIAAVFPVLARTHTRWPAPRQALDALRPREPLPALSKPAADPERARRAIAEVQELLRPDHRKAAAGDES